MLKKKGEVMDFNEANKEKAKALLPRLLTVDDSFVLFVKEKDGRMTEIIYNFKLFDMCYAKERMQIKILEGVGALQTPNVM